MRVLFTSLLILVVSNIVVAQQSDGVRKTHLNIKKNIALDGYDPVSYFDGDPREGDDNFSLTHRGVIYKFSSATNLNKFKASPEKYEPAYGGWCAFAMGENGEKVKVDPETYKLIGGKVYLFYNFWGNNTLEDWNMNEKKLKASADQNWGKITR
jgi:YHS domain-containing protein